MDKTMNIETYTQARPGETGPRSLTFLEAKILNVPFPLEPNWRVRYGLNRIHPRMHTLLNLSKTKGQKKKDRVFFGRPPTPEPPPKRLAGKNFYTSPEWLTLRYRVLELYGATCQCCGATREDGVKIHVDHIKPRSLYPALQLDFRNMQVLCEPCNIGKSNQDETDWRPAEFA